MRKTLKRTLTVLLAALLVMTVAGCTGKKTEDPVKNPEVVSNPQPGDTVEARTAIVFKHIEGNKATVTREGADQDSYEGMRLLAGDVITTDEASSVYLRIDDDKNILLDKNTSVKIAELKSGKLSLYLDYGQFFFDIVNKLPEGEELNFELGSATMSIRGTSGAVSRVGEVFKTLQAVLFDGRVDLDIVGKSQHLTLGSGCALSLDTTGSGTIQALTVKAAEPDITPKVALWYADNTPEYLGKVDKSEAVYGALSISVGPGIALANSVEVLSDPPGPIGWTQQADGSWVYNEDDYNAGKLSEFSPAVPVTPAPAPAPVVPPNPGSSSSGSASTSGSTSSGSASTGGQSQPSQSTEPVKPTEPTSTKHILTLQATDHSVIYAVGYDATTIELEEGQKVNLSASVIYPDARFVGIYNGDVCVSQTEGYEFTMGNSDVTLYAKCELPQQEATLYTLTLQGDDHSTITFGDGTNEPKQLAEGDEVIVIVIPDDNYVIEDILENGTSYGTSGEFTYTMPDDDVTLSVVTAAENQNVNICQHCGEEILEGEEGKHALMNSEEAHAYLVELFGTGSNCETMTLCGLHYLCELNEINYDTLHEHSEHLNDGESVCGGFLCDGNHDVCYSCSKNIVCLESYLCPYCQHRFCDYCIEDRAHVECEECGECSSSDTFWQTHEINNDGLVIHTNQP